MDYQVSGVTAQDSGNIPTVGAWDDFADGSAAHEHSVEVLVEEGLNPELTAAGGDHAQEAVQIGLCAGVGAGDVESAAEADELTDSGVHNWDSLTDCAVEGDFAIMQGYVGVQDTEGVCF